MSIQDIILRLLLITVFASLIGYEREKHYAYAGLRTHLLVAISATIIALIQQSIVLEVIAFQINNPGIDVLKSDPARLIATVVSGIGFLGAGTIIVTKRNITGLTTAASIWSVAGLGIAVGMGYLRVSVIGFIFLFSALSFVKQLFQNKFDERVYIEYIGGSHTILDIENIFESLGLKSEHRGFKAKPFGGDLIYASTFDITGPKDTSFKELVGLMSQNKNIASIQLTNINE